MKFVLAIGASMIPGRLPIFFELVQVEAYLQRAVVCFPWKLDLLASLGYEGTMQEFTL